MTDAPRSRRTVAALVAAGVVVAGLGAWAGAAWTGADDETVLVVPEEYRGLVRSAAQRCPQVPAAVLAAQIDTESRWRADAVSPAGAQGIAQFLPATWKQYGVDGDGDGDRDVFDPADAIPAAASLNCVNYRLVRSVPGDAVGNVLAAYNAGYNQVRRYGGVPPFPETQAYVARILRLSASAVL